MKKELKNAIGKIIRGENKSNKDGLLEMAIQQGYVPKNVS